MLENCSFIVHKNVSSFKKETKQIPPTITLTKKTRTTKKKPNQNPTSQTKNTPAKTLEACAPDKNFVLHV